MLIAVPAIHAESLSILNHSCENGVMDAANFYGTTSDWEVGGYDVSNAGVWIDDNLDADIYRPTKAEYTDPKVDPDGDGIGNGLENFFGTNPGTFTQGLLAGTKSANTFTFTHPQNATRASDLTASHAPDLEEPSRRKRKTSST